MRTASPSPFAPRLLVLAFSLFPACASAPKQQPLPPIEESTQTDMPTEKPANPDLKEGEGAQKPPSGEDMHAACCTQCREALRKDKTGTPPDKIPCADYGPELKPWCLEHFREKGTMAGECALQ